MEIDIRTYRHQDRAGVTELWRRCGLVHPRNDPNKDIDRKSRHGLDLFIVAVDPDGLLVGSAMGGYEGHRGWVNYVSVLPELQGRGIGRAMMADLEARFRALGCAKINLQVRKANTAVIDFYRRIGFDLDDVVCMGKRLEHDDDSS